MYLLDTDTILFIFKGKFDLDKKINTVGFENCLMSEITLAELKYGAAKSARPDFHGNMVNEFAQRVQVLPIQNSLDIFATEKARLEKIGTRLDNFDLLIGATAISNNLTLVTHNVFHFSRMAGVRIEDWTVQP